MTGSTTTLRQDILDAVTECETPEGFSGYLARRSNWGRWGADDQRGALNLTTPDRVRAGLAAVRDGRQISLARNLDKSPGFDNPYPTKHFIEWKDRSTPHEANAGMARDWFFMGCHGLSSTHVDALNHVWGEHGAWNGRPADEIVDPSAMKWAGVEVWQDGIVTRGVLIDVAAQREKGYVDLDAPLTGQELLEIAQRQGVQPQPGDALAVYCGRDRWDEHEPKYGTTGARVANADVKKEARPGWHPSAVAPVREWDVAVVLWDMMDHLPQIHGLAWEAHSMIHMFGICLVDNADLGGLAALCRELGRWEFLLTLSPLRLVGATGSPVNPIAML